MDIPGGDMLQKNQEQQVRINTNAQQEQQNAFQKPVDFSQIEKEKYENKFAVKTEEELLQRNLEIRSNRKLKETSSRQKLIESAEELKNASQILAQDQKWYRFFQRESDEMTRVKNSLHYLNNLMEQGIFSMDKALLRETVNQAYITLLDACDTYVTTHRNKAKYSEGKRRMARVKQVRAMAQTEMDRFKIAANNYVMGMLDTTGMKTVRDLTSGVVEEQAVVSRFMTQGNSSNVYRQILKPHEETEQKKQIPENETAEAKRLREMAERDQAERAEILKHHVYVKKDEPLLNEDLPAYLDRRMKELTRSRDNKAAYGSLSKEAYLEKVKAQEREIDELDRKVAAGEMEEREATEQINTIRASQEELRLVGRLDDKDYELADKFLKALKDGLQNGDKEAKLKRYINFLGHDFERVFNDLKDYNETVEQAQKDQESLKKTIKMLEDDLSKPGAKEMLAFLKKGLAEGGLQKKNEYQWISENARSLGLDPSQDQDILKVLLEMQRADGEEMMVSDRISKLFNRSLGKEAELFGQQCERSGLSDTQALASNNTATARIAKLCGMQDVVTRSWKSMLTFQEIGQKGEEKTTAMCTLSEEAEGEEMLSLVERAEKAGAKLCYSPNAIRQKIRLQMFDTLCLQTDRHWRNFKCKVTEQNDKVPPVWTVESLKSYDHDQSFGPKNLNQYFEIIKDPAGLTCTSRPGFLPPLIATVDKRSKLYSYLKTTKMGGSNDNILDSIHRPAPKEGAVKLMDDRRKSKGTDFYEDSRVFHYIGEWVRVQMSGWDAEESESSTKGSAYYQNAVKQNDTKGAEAVERFFQCFHSLIEKVTTLKDPDNPMAGSEYKNPSSVSKTGAESEAAGDRKAATHVSILKDLRNLQQLYQTLDLSKIDQGVDVNWSLYLGNIRGVNGVFDYMVQAFMHQVKMMYGSDPSVLEALEKEDQRAEEQKLWEEAQKRATEENKDPEQIKKELEKNRKSDTIEVPTLLHMDLEAYEGIKAIDEQWETVEMTLRDLGWSDEKRRALHERAQQIVEQAKKAQRIVDEWGAKMGYEQDDIRRKFFLEPEDYSKINSLTDIAADPSMSYFSIEDPNFLAGVTEYRNLMTETDHKKIIETTNKMRKTPRQSLELLKDTYRQMVSNEINISPNSGIMPTPEHELKKQ